MGKWSRFFTGVLKAGRKRGEPDCAHPELINSINKENRRKAGNAERNRGGEKAVTENPAKPLRCPPPPTGTVSIRVKTQRFQLLPLI